VSGGGVTLGAAAGGSASGAVTNTVITPLFNFVPDLSPTIGFHQLGK
jgi:hypothetical protein